MSNSASSVAPAGRGYFLLRAMGFAALAGLAVGVFAGIRYFV